ncbi:Conserved_hypothetical protein [Hexamita inflata]|uniref:Uncharacterized protein n=1 Tax=Hexamita inflata TaxID=28002 RepID=A0ABP1KV31_9EUKA
MNKIPAKTYPDFSEFRNNSSYHEIAEEIEIKPEKVLTQGATRQEARNNKSVKPQDKILTTNINNENPIQQETEPEDALEDLQDYTSKLQNRMKQNQLTEDNESMRKVVLDLKDQIKELKKQLEANQKAENSKPVKNQKPQFNLGVLEREETDPNQISARGEYQNDADEDFALNSDLDNTSAVLPSQTTKQSVQLSESKKGAQKQINQLGNQSGAKEPNDKNDKVSNQTEKITNTGQNSAEKQNESQKPSKTQNKPRLTNVNQTDKQSSVSDVKRQTDHYQHQNQTQNDFQKLNSKIYNQNIIQSDLNNKDKLQSSENQNKEPKNESNLQNVDEQIKFNKNDKQDLSNALHNQLETNQNNIVTSNDNQNIQQRNQANELQNNVDNDLYQPQRQNKQEQSKYNNDNILSPKLSQQKGSKTVPNKDESQPLNQLPRQLSNRNLTEKDKQQIQQTNNILSPKSNNQCKFYQELSHQPIQSQKNNMKNDIDNSNSILSFQLQNGNKYEKQSVSSYQQGPQKPENNYNQTNSQFSGNNLSQNTDGLQPNEISNNKLLSIIEPNNQQQNQHNSNNINQQQEMITTREVSVQCEIIFLDVSGQIIPQELQNNQQAHSSVDIESKALTQQNESDIQGSPLYYNEQQNDQDAYKTNVSASKQDQSFRKNTFEPEIKSSLSVNQSNTQDSVSKQLQKPGPRHLTSANSQSQKQQSQQPQKEHFANTRDKSASQTNQSNKVETKSSAYVNSNKKAPLAARVGSSKLETNESQRTELPGISKRAASQNQATRKPSLDLSRSDFSDDVQFKLIGLVYNSIMTQPQYLLENDLTLEKCALLKDFIASLRDSIPRPQISSAFDLLADQFYTEQKLNNYNADLIHEFNNVAKQADAFRDFGVQVDLNMNHGQQLDLQLEELEMRRKTFISRNKQVKPQTTALREFDRFYQQVNGMDIYERLYNLSKVLRKRQFERQKYYEQLGFEKYYQKLESELQTSEVYAEKFYLDLTLETDAKENKRGVPMTKGINLAWKIGDSKRQGDTEYVKVKSAK